MTQWRGTPHLGTRLWELARAPHGGGKIRRFLTKQLLLSYNTDDSSPFRSSLWPWNEADRRLRSAVLLWSPPASYHSAAAVPKTRRCVPPPKKAETFRQGRASLTGPSCPLQVCSTKTRHIEFVPRRVCFITGHCVAAALTALRIQLRREAST